MISLLKEGFFRGYPTLIYFRYIGVRMVGFKAAATLKPSLAIILNGFTDVAILCKGTRRLTAEYVATIFEARPD